MPTYVYECKACEKTFEVEQRIVEDPLTSCQCGAEGHVKRVMQPTAIMFKGTGFYVNDSKSAGTVGSKDVAATSDDAPTCTGNPTSCQACAQPAES